MSLPFSIGTTFDGRLVFGDVLVARQHPGDLGEVDAVLVLQDAARPHAGGDGVAAVDADALAFEVLRACVMPALLLTRMAPWWKARTRNTGTAVIGLPCALAQI